MASALRHPAFNPCVTPAIVSPSADQPMYVHIRPLLTDGVARVAGYQGKESRQFHAYNKLTPMRLDASPQGVDATDLVGSPPPTIQESTHESDGSTTGGSDESQRDSTPPSSNHGHSSPPTSKANSPGSVIGSSSGKWSEISLAEDDQRVGARCKRTAKTPILQGPRTTITLTGLPSYFTQKMLMVFLDSEGFERGYDLIYLPMDFEKQVCLGYALINLVSIQVAERCFAHFSNFPVTVAWSGSLQGLIPCVEKYRNSPIMHHTVPDHLKPALFVDGRRVDFPMPTVEIPEPAMRQIDSAC